MKSRKKEVQSNQDARQKLNKFWNDACYVGRLAYKLRSVLLSIPVAVAALSLAIRNMAKLPEQVGLNLQASGEYAMMVGKGVAVMGPLAITAVCLLLVFCSRRVVYPWLISLFSLVLPLVIWFTNTFPN